MNALKDITEYPVAELIVASGFFIVLSLEQIVMGVCVAKNENKKKNKKEHEHEHKNHDSGKAKTFVDSFEVTRSVFRTVVSNWHRVISLNNASSVNFWQRTV